MPSTFGESHAAVFETIMKRAKTHGVCRDTYLRKKFHPTPIDEKVEELVAAKFVQSRDSGRQLLPTHEGMTQLAWWKQQPKGPPNLEDGDEDAETIAPPPPPAAAIPPVEIAPQGDPDDEEDEPVVNPTVGDDAAEPLDKSIGEKKVRQMGGPRRTGRAREEER